MKVSLKTAKLAQEKGFNEICRNGYYETLAHTLDCGRGGEMDFPYIEPRILERRNYDHSVLIAQAPTQSLLQRWLREVHNIYIEILLGEDRPYNQFYYRLMKLGQYSTLSHDGFYRKSYEEVLEEALQQALIKI